MVKKGYTRNYTRKSDRINIIEFFYIWEKILNNEPKQGKQEIHSQYM